jgi:hypothetical protein
LGCRQISIRSLAISANGPINIFIFTGIKGVDQI